MQMQEPEQRQANQESGQNYAGYRADYSGSFASEQQQKIYPQEERSSLGAVFSMVITLLASIGFFLAVAGIVASGVVLKFASGQPDLVAGGVIGLVSSIILLLILIAIFVLSVVYLALRSVRARGRLRTRRWQP
jgi:uncharacterized BrkB/YihY/UPF0761 family membrane protein